MSLLRRMTYMGVGALLVLAVILGGVVAFAQSGDDAETPAAQDDGTQSPDTNDSETQEDGATEETVPAYPHPDFRGGPPVDEEALLADALGISVEDLQAAREEAFSAALDEALAQGLITEEQAQQLQERGLGRGFGPDFGRVLGLDKDELLADALNISVEELQAARAEVRAARLDAMVEAGVITQEQADLIAAREAVQSYIDRDALAAMVQDAYQAAVDQAVADGAISQAQADQLLQSFSAPNFRFGGVGEPFGGRGGHGPHGGFHHGPGNFFVPDSGTAAPNLDNSAGA